jgi:hydroxymethylbilane synthase
LIRLGLDAAVDEVLEPDVLLPQVAQGALAVECRVDDAAAIDRLAAIDDDEAHRTVRAERAFLGELGGGCDLPCGALARVQGEDVAIEVLLASLDGHVVLRAHARGSEPESTGVEAARVLLDDNGGATLLVGSTPS